MKVVYPKGRQAFGAGDLDWDAHTFKVALVAGYTYDALDQFVSDITGIVARSSALASKTNVDGLLDAADLVFASVATGSTIDGYIVYKDTGSDATSPLVGYVNEQPDTSAISVPTNGSNIDLQFDATGVIQL